MTEWYDHNQAEKDLAETGTSDHRLADMLRRIAALEEAVAQLQRADADQGGAK